MTNESTDASPEKSARSAEIGKQVFSSLRWLVAGRFTGQLVSWTVTLVIVRILSPDDYGLMALAALLIGLAEVVREMGLGSALIQRKELDDDLLRRVFGFLLIVNSTLYCVLFFAAPYVAALFGEARVTGLMRVLALQFPVMSFSVIPLAFISRRMQFKRQAIVQFCAMTVASLSTLGLALAGLGVWALVWGNMLQQLTMVLGLNMIAKYWARPSFRFSGLKQIMAFGGLVTLNRILWYAYSRAGNLTVGKMLGKTRLGFYSIGGHFATLPMAKISGILNQVGFAAYSRIQHDRALVAAHYYKAARIVSFVAFPVFWGISCVAPEIVSVLLGEKWLMATLPLQILSLVAPLLMLSTSGAPAITALGRPGIETINLIIACIVMPAAFVIGGSQWGLRGVCYAWVTAYPVLFVIMCLISFPVIGVRLGTYFLHVGGSALTGAAMYAVVGLTRFAIGDALAAPITFGVLVLTGVVTYGGLSLGFRRDACREMRRIFVT